MTTATDKLRELWDDELDAVSGGLYASIALIALLAAQGMSDQPPDHGRLRL